MEEVFCKKVEEKHAKIGKGERWQRNMARVRNCSEITILINLFGQDHSQGGQSGLGGWGGQGKGHFVWNSKVAISGSWRLSTVSWSLSLQGVGVGLPGQKNRKKESMWNKFKFLETPCRGWGRSRRRWRGRGKRLPRGERNTKESLRSGRMGWRRWELYDQIQKKGAKRSFETLPCSILPSLDLDLPLTSTCRYWY